MVNVWLVGAEGANLVQLLPEEERGIFWSANACASRSRVRLMISARFADDGGHSSHRYMVLYSYALRGAERTALFFWKGSQVPFPEPSLNLP